MQFDSRPKPLAAALFDRTLRHSTLQDDERHALALELKTSERLLAAAQHQLAEERTRAVRACACVATLQLAMRDLEGIVVRQDVERADEVRRVATEQERWREEQRVHLERCAASDAEVERLRAALAEARTSHQAQMAQAQGEWDVERAGSDRVLLEQRALFERSLEREREQAVDSLAKQSAVHGGELANVQRRLNGELTRLRAAYIELQSQTGAAVVLQRTSRGRGARVQTTLMRAAAVHLQAAARRLRARRQLTRTRQAAAKAQAVMRARTARLAYMSARGASECIQKAARALSARRRLHEHRSARRLQAAIRGWCERVHVAAYLQDLHAWREFEAERQRQLRVRGLIDDDE